MQGRREESPSQPSIITSSFFCIISIFRVMQNMSQPQRLTSIDSTWASTCPLNMYPDLGPPFWSPRSGLLGTDKATESHHMTNRGQRCKGKVQRTGGVGGGTSPGSGAPAERRVRRTSWAAGEGRAPQAQGTARQGPGRPCAQEQKEEEKEPKRRSRGSSCHIQQAVKIRPGLLFSTVDYSLTK